MKIRSLNSLTCPNCSESISFSAKLGLLFRGLDLPLQCNSCYSKIQLDTSSLLIAFWILGIGGSSAAAAQGGLIAPALTITLCAAIFVLCMLVMPLVEVESTNSSDQIPKSVNWKGVAVVSLGAIYSFIVLVVWMNLAAAISMLVASLYSAKEKPRLYISLLLALMSFVLLMLGTN